MTHRWCTTFQSRYCGLLTGHLSDNLFIADVGLDRCLPNEEEHRAYQQRDHRDTPIHRSHCEVLIKFGIQGEMKITMTPTALAISPTSEHR